MDEEKPEPHRRRKRYSGTHPRSFRDKYKELNPERYGVDLAKVIARGDTPVGTHRPICVREILEALRPSRGEIAVDATLGYGGHAREILRKILPEGRLYGLDQDPLELPKTEARLRAEGFGALAFAPRALNFALLPRLLAEEGLPGVDVILADLGISSMQIDDPARGFTYKRNGPLDMRMNPGNGMPAAELLRWISAEKLRSVLEKNADEPAAGVIALAINRHKGTITTTRALADAIREAFPDRAKGDAETTKALQRTFQALRIEVNGEFAALDSLLANLPACLNAHGRVAILAFHSGEDRRVELAFKQGLENGSYSSISAEAIRPGREERYGNPRSTSARLRWAVRTKDGEA